MATIQNIESVSIFCSIITAQSPDVAQEVIFNYQLSNELAALLPSLLNDLDLDEKAFTAYVLKLTDLDDGLDTADLALELGVLSLIIARLSDWFLIEGNNELERVEWCKKHIIELYHQYEEKQLCDAFQIWLDTLHKIKQQKYVA